MPSSQRGKYRQKVVIGPKSGRVGLPADRRKVSSAGAGGSNSDPRLKNLTLDVHVPSPPIFTFLAPLASFRKRFVVREVQGRGEPLNGFQASSFFAHRRTHGLFFVCTVNCEGDHSPLISVRDRQQLHQLVRVQPASRIFLPPTPLQPQPQLDPYR